MTDLDDTIRQIRSAIFALQAPRTPGRGLRHELLSLIVEAAASLGFEPHVSLDGPLDAAVPNAIADHLLATVREALSNVVRHAGATRVAVRAAVAADELVVTITDDGIGPGPAERPGGNGLPNIRKRADALGGTFTIAPATGKGTTVVWRVPLSAPN